MELAGAKGCSTATSEVGIAAAIGPTISTYQVDLAADSTSRM